MNLKSLFIFSIFLFWGINSFSQSTRVWATYYGGSGNDYSTCITVDASGNVYLGGQTTSSNSIASGGFQNTYGGNTDAFLVKFDAAGNRIWATYYGGSDNDFGSDIAIDASGNIYLGGTTKSATGIASGGFQNTYNGNGNSDAYLAKFDATTGNLVWATYYGGDDGDIGRSVATDGTGNVYLAGVTASNTGIASGGFQNALMGGILGDAFLVKFNSAGNLQWATYYGDGGDDLGNSVDTDAAGNVYLAGTTYSTTGIASGGFQNTYGGGTTDAFLVKFDTAGNRIWATYYGDAGDDECTSVEASSPGILYLTGHTTSTANIASGGYQNTYAGGTTYGDVFLIKFGSATCNRIWGSYYGDVGEEEGNNVVTDVAGNIYLGLDTYSPGSALGLNGFQASFVGTENQVLVKFDPNGTRLCATYYGQVHDEKGCVAVDPVGNLYFEGQTQSLVNIASGGFQNTFGGSTYDGYLVRFNSCFNNILSVTATSTSVTCNGQCTGTATASATGTSPYTYAWLPSGGTSSTATGLCAGNYTVSVTDGMSSTTTATVTIAEPLLLTASVTATAASCGNNNGSASVTAGGGTPSYSYLWNPGGATTTSISGLSVGNYSTTVTDANGCTQTQSVLISSSSTFSIVATSTQAGCTVNNGTATANPTSGTPPFTYSWNNGQTTQTSTGLSIGTYTATLTDANGCSATQTVVVTSNNTLSVSVTSTLAGCAVNIGTATANASGGTAGYTYNWNNGQSTQTATGLGIGNYTTIVSDANGCTKSQTVSITFNNTLNVTTTFTPVSCVANDGTATANATGGTPAYTYSWSNGQTSQIATGLAIGSYTCLIVDAYGCTKTQTISLSQIPGPTVTVTSSPVIIYSGSNTTLVAGGGGDYSWTPATGLSCTTCSNPTANPTQTTAYCVVVTDSNGCKDSACVTVVVDIDCSKAGELFLPNAFSPNGDGENDFLQLFYGSAECIEDFKLVIYNRWGQNVFESDDPTFQWDGTNENKYFETAVFVYYLKATLVDGEKISRKGNISLMK